MDINKKIKLLDFKLSKILNGTFFGSYKNRFNGNGMEFSKHSEYSFSDQVKDIDWKASSKTDQIYTKKYTQEKDLNTLFLLDISESMDFGSEDKTKKDILEDIFYSLSVSAYLNNDSLGVFLYNLKEFIFLQHKKSNSNIYKSFDYISKFSKLKTKKLFKEKYENKTENILSELNKRNIKNNLIFVLTDDSEFNNEKILKVVGDQNEIIFINIFDYFENNLALVKGNASLNIFNNFLNIDLSDNKKVEKYIFLRRNRIKAYKDFLRKNKVGYISLDNKTDIFKEIISYFNKVNN